jgi:protein-tyrosine phosphatase
MRNVNLPSGVPGQLYLHNMPGRYADEPIGKFLADAASKHVGCVVCLAPLDEIRNKSPEYAKLLEAKVPWDRIDFPIPDFGVPGKQALTAQAQEIATRLRAGTNLLIHCGAGIGRTGMMAMAVLMGLGHSHAEALLTVKAAGSCPETPEQTNLLKLISEDGTQ